MKSANIETEHTYSQSPSIVWKCLTEPVLLAQWWAPGNIKAEVGHRFEMDMGPYGKQPCEILKVEKKHLLQFRFIFGTTVTWELSQERSGTKLNLKHEGFDLDHPMGQKAYEGMSKGWPMVIARMQPVLDQM